MLQLIVVEAIIIFHLLSIFVILKTIIMLNERLFWDNFPNNNPGWIKYVKHKSFKETNGHPIDIFMNIYVVF